MTTFTGKRIVLRPYRAEDIDALFLAVNDPVLRGFTGTQATFTLEQAQRYIANFATADDRVGFVIALPETLEPLGEVVILNIDEENRGASLRISLFNVNNFDKGYGSEAMGLTVEYAFKTLKLHRLSLDVFDFNPRAVGVYKKIGFKQEGVMRDTLYYEGKFHSSIMMSILENEWIP